MQRKIPQGDRNQQLVLSVLEVFVELVYKPISEAPPDPKGLAASCVSSMVCIMSLQFTKPPLGPAWDDAALIQTALCPPGLYSLTAVFANERLMLGKNWLKNDIWSFKNLIFEITDDS